MWKDIKVGQIIKVYRDQSVPADLVLLKSSDPKGCCYVETKGLDGETNLKMKNIPSKLQELDEIKEISVSCELPNNSIYKFEGSIKVDYERLPLCIDNLIMRGSSIKNTDHMYGIVVFTGHDTKVMQNTEKALYKFSHLERSMNLAIILILLS